MESWDLVGEDEGVLARGKADDGSLPCSSVCLGENAH